MTKVTIVLSDVDFNNDLENGTYCEINKELFLFALNKDLTWINSFKDIKVNVDIKEEK